VGFLSFRSPDYPITDLPITRWDAVMQRCSNSILPANRAAVN
jgi:hypothetical protein